MSPMHRWCALVALLHAVAGCTHGGDAMQRCRELEPKLTAAAAWQDIDATNDAAKEWTDLRCRELLK